MKPFYKILRAEKTVTRLHHHFDFLTSCREHNVIPTGFAVNKVATVNRDLFSPLFFSDWDSRLHRTSSELVESVLAHLPAAIRTAESHLEDVTNEFLDSGLLSLAEWCHVRGDVARVAGKYQRRLAKTAKDKLRALLHANRTSRPRFCSTPAPVRAHDWYDGFHRADGAFEQTDHNRGAHGALTDISCVPDTPLSAQGASRVPDTHSADGASRVPDTPQSGPLGTPQSAHGAPSTVSPPLPDPDIGAHGAYRTDISRVPDFLSADGASSSESTYTPDHVKSAPGASLSVSAPSLQDAPHTHPTTTTGASLSVSPLLPPPSPQDASHTASPDLTPASPLPFHCDTPFTVPRVPSFSPTSVAPGPSSDTPSSSAQGAHVGISTQPAPPIPFSLSILGDCDATSEIRPGFLAPTMDSISLRDDEYTSVINLSPLVLTRDQLSVLNLGLNFCPVPPELNVVELKQDFKDFARKMRLKEFFSKQEPEPYIPVPFKPKGTFNPQPQCKFLETYLASVENTIFTESNQGRDFHRNLTSAQANALKELRTNPRIIIRDADKGSGVVVMDRDRYIAEAQRQLSDTSSYLKLPSDPSDKYARELTKLVNRVHKNGTITDEMKAHATLEENRPGRLYLLPKVHKPGTPGRPVISCSGALTENISEIVDYLVKPLLPHVTSYLRDTKDFVHKIRELESFPEDAILASLDVSNLYGSIPHDQGIQALATFLRRHGFSERKTSDVCDLARFILTHNHFEFNCEMYLQISGTAMGTRMAPTYAIIFMHVLESRFLRSVPVKPFKWLRYIDDVFCIWTHGEDSFNDFLARLNSSDPSIHFTEEHSQCRVPFLDVMVEKAADNTVLLDLYTKQTDTHMYLHPASCHPGHVKNAIAYGQALRILRICTLRETALQRLEQLTTYLTVRGHSVSKVRKEIKRAIQFFDNPSPQQSAPKPAVDRVNFVLTYHPALPNISKTLRDEHHLLHLNPNLKIHIPEPPRLAFRRPANLRNQLSRAKVPPLEAPPPAECGPCVTHKTRKTLCTICKILPIQTSITSFSTGRTHRLRLPITATCDSEYAVYCLTCTKCGLQYVGQAQKFRIRVNNHRSVINRNEVIDHGCRVLYEHFAQSDHSVDDVRFSILELSKRNKASLDSAERKWIGLLDTVHPSGLNACDGFSSRSGQRS